MDEQSPRGASNETWQAYNAMETTKRRHFDFLSALESGRKKFNREPTEAQSALLERLLRDHDEQVRAFTKASQRLRASDPEAFDGLWTYINEINEALAPIREHEGH